MDVCTCLALTVSEDVLITERAGIDYGSLAYGAQEGFVTVGTNNGHNGTIGSAFLNNPDVIVDFVYRSYVTVPKPSLQRHAH